MKTRLILLSSLAALGFSASPVPADDTFSIVAVDPLTAEVGSAGASCISGSIIISDVHPGVGAIHTQAYWNSQNQSYARQLMDQGHSPQEIIDLLVANDAQGNPTIRQYGIVDLSGGGRSAAYTGVNCSNYKGHILGPTYAIAGNILLGPEILDGMESAFLGTPGPLSDRLMAALQGAKVVGADSRCLDDGKSSISAFIRVARPGDVPGGYHLDLNVNTTPPGVDPIDVLQGLYDEWAAGSSAPDASAPVRFVLYPCRPNPTGGETHFRYDLPVAADVSLKLFDVAGREVSALDAGRRDAGSHEVSWRRGTGFPSGVYFFRLDAGPFRGVGKFLLLEFR
jgi:uncharacterized Ntn-hydrolase superfamily protein